MKDNVTFKFYDEKGRRLAIFYNILTSNELELFTLTCSDKDQFSRKLSRAIHAEFEKGNFKGDIASGTVEIELDGELYHPNIAVVKMFDEDRPKWSFIQYCRKHFLRMYTELLLVERKYLA